MFEITVLSFVFAQPPIQIYNLKVRSLSSSRIEKQTDLCCGRSFQWNEKFICSQQEIAVQFEVINISGSSNQERIGAGIYNFTNSNEQIVNSNQRQIKIYNRGHLIGILHITILYIQTNQFHNIQTLHSHQTFGQKQYNPISQYSSPIKQSYVTANMQWSTGIKQPNAFITPTKRQQLLPPPIILQLPKNIQFAKGQTLFKNMFSCLDNFDQQWQLAPNLIRK